MKRWLTLLVGVAGWFAAGPAQAKSCAVVATPLAFGPYTSPNGPRVDSAATVQVSCTPTYLLLACTTSYTVSLSAGSVGTPGARAMAAGAGRLRYDLFRDAARSQPWGDGGGGGSTVGGTITSGLLGLLCAPGTRSHTVYGRIPASQNVPAGSYQDQVVLTITY